MRLFQEEDYITIDFHNGILEEYKICAEAPELGETDQVIPLDGREKKYVLYRKPNVPKHDALKEELIHFAHSIQNAQKPETDGESAAQTLSIALKIQKIIDQ